MSISFFICVTLGNVFKMKSTCFVCWSGVLWKLRYHWSYNDNLQERVSRQLAHEENFYSQNHSIGEIGRELWRPPSPTPLLKAGSTRTGCSELCSAKSWNTSKDRESSKFLVKMFYDWKYSLLFRNIHHYLINRVLWNH